MTQANENPEINEQEKVEEQVQETTVETEEQPIEAELAGCYARINELETYIAEADKREQDIQLRAQAEIQNMRRRAEQEVEKAHKFALEKFSKELLTVVD